MSGLLFCGFQFWHWSISRFPGQGWSTDCWHCLGNECVPPPVNSSEIFIFVCLPLIWKRRSLLLEFPVVSWKYQEDELKIIPLDPYSLAPAAPSWIPAWMGGGAQPENCCLVPGVPGRGVRMAGRPKSSVWATGPLCLTPSLCASC